MNKKLIAIAIAAAVSAPAMAATSNVEVYGLMNIGVDSVTNGSGVAGNHDTTRVGRVTDYVSRIGFKGTEDLGNGLAAVWQIEQQISSDGSDGAGAGVLGQSATGASLRNTFVGLKSKDMGEVRLGRHDTPYKMATGSLDQFGDTMADYNGLVSAANGRGASSYFDQRASNVVAYITPNFSGFTAVGAYVFGAESATTGSPDSSGNAYSLAGMYTAGPLYLTAAYEKHNFGSAGVGSLGGVANTDEKAWKLGASYSIMDFTLAAMYEKTDDSLAAGANKYGHRTWFLSGKYQMGAVALKAQYANAGSDDQTFGTVKGDDGAKQYSLGVDYGFSKRTTLYALYSKVSNDTNAAYGFKEGNVAGLVAGDTISGVTVGMKHSF
ncbi:MAG: porin [Sulfuriferula sp.]